MYRSAPLILLLPLAPVHVAAVHDHRLREPDVAPAAAGRIAGRVEISTSLAARRPNFRIYADTRSTSVAPRVPANELVSELRNVIVYVEDARDAPATNGGTANREMPAVMSQTGERFEPHVLSVLQGATVEFPNYDDVYHNVFSLSRARTFDLGRYPRNASKSVRFDRAGVVQVFCHIHADMSGIVMVLPNPYFAAPDSAGRYVIEDIPPGEYTIVGWHERTRPVRQRVTVVAGRTTTIDFKLPLGMPDA